MFTIKCKCGKTSMSFKNLTEKDFSDGWEAECCKGQAEEKEEEAPEKEEKAPYSSKSEKKDKSCS